MHQAPGIYNGWMHASKIKGSKCYLPFDLIFFFFFFFLYRTWPFPFIHQLNELSTNDPRQMGQGTNDDGDDAIDPEMCIRLGQAYLEVEMGKSHQQPPTAIDHMGSYCLYQSLQGLNRITSSF